MKRIGFTILMIAFLASCTAVPTAQMTATLMATSNPVPPTNTPAPTKIPAFRVGLPEALEGCNFLDLKYKEDGSIDAEWLAGQLEILSGLEHQWLKENEIQAVEDTGFLVGGEIETDENLPFSTVRATLIGGETTTISCLRFSFEGNVYTIYGFPMHREGVRDNSQIVMIHAVFDYIGRSKYNLMDNSPRFNLPPIDPRDFHKKLFDRQSNISRNLKIFVSGYYENPDLFGDWPLAQALIYTNDNESREKSCSGVLVNFLDNELVDSLSIEDEENSISQIEQCLFPLEDMVTG